MTQHFSFANKYIDSFPKLIYFLSALFLLGALWYEWLHYGFFGINIFTYISLSDAVGLFIEHLFLMVALSAGLMIFFMIIQSIFSISLAKILHLSKYNRRNRKIKLFKNLNVLLIIGIVPMVLFMGIIPSVFKGSYKTEEFLIIRALIFLFAIFYVAYISMSYERPKYETNYFSGKAAILTLIIMFFVVIYYYHRWQLLDIKGHIDSPTRTTYRILLRDNKIITCEDSVRMIGKTKDYLFLVAPNNINYDLSSVRILKMEDVKEITVIKLLRWYSVMP